MNHIFKEVSNHGFDLCVKSWQCTSMARKHSTVKEVWKALFYAFNRLDPLHITSWNMELVQIDLKQRIWAVKTTDRIANVLTDHIAAEELL